MGVPDYTIYLSFYGIRNIAQRRGLLAGPIRAAAGVLAPPWSGLSPTTSSRLSLCSLHYTLCYTMYYAAPRVSPVPYVQVFKKKYRSRARVSCRIRNLEWYPSSSSYSYLLSSSSSSSSSSYLPSSSSCLPSSSSCLSSSSSCLSSSSSCLSSPECGVRPRMMSAAFSAMA